jgi:nitrous oxidase accessory protein NosD
MADRRARRSRLALATGVLLGTAGIAHAATVDCNKGDKIGPAVAAASAGERIVIRGTCRESVRIPPSAYGLVLEGEGDASIVGPEPREAVILVLGREIAIRRLRLRQGRNGINVLRGASAAIDGVVIEDAGQQQPIPGSGLGMNIGQHAFASVINSTIRNNRVAGILVHENSGARIGFVDVATIVAGNKIEDNGRGIVIEESAQARVVGTAISGNKGFGIYVARASHLEFADNLIEANGDDGVHVIGASGAIVEIGDGAVRTPNRTSGDKMNGGFGVSCSLGGYVAGPLGSLTGRKGATNISGNCSNGLAP